MKYLAVLWLLLILACKGKQDKKQLPLSESKLKEVLRDAHKLEGDYTVQFFNQKDLNQQLNSRYDSLFQTHGIQREDFFRTFTVYSREYTEDLDTIYQELLTEFEARKDSLQRLAEDRKPVKERATVQKKLKFEKQ